MLCVCLFFCLGKVRQKSDKTDERVALSRSEAGPADRLRLVAQAVRCNSTAIPGLTYRPPGEHAGRRRHAIFPQVAVDVVGQVRV